MGDLCKHDRERPPFRRLGVASVICIVSILVPCRAISQSAPAASGGSAATSSVTTGAVPALKATAPKARDATPVSRSPEKPPTIKPRTQAAGTMSAVTYDPISFDELPGWADDDHLAALKAFQASCPRVIAGKAGTGKAATEPLTAALVPVCAAAMALPAKVTRVEARTFLERNFQPHRIVHKGAEGLLTAYYEPILEGSRTRQGRFQAPIFKRPSDLVTIVPETRGSVPGSLTHARKTAAGLVPFSTRAEIEAGALGGQGLELLYLQDTVDKYFLQIQGSGRIRLTDGTFVRVQYDGKNGHPYTSIGRYLIDKGLLAADKMSMGALGRWLKADIERARMVMNQNASYVFFREMPADASGPLGAIEVPLVAGRSLAIDPGHHRLGSPIYVSAPTLTPVGHKRPFNRLMVAHDVGGAIKGPERADLYFGSGETAERQASTVRHPGNLFVLVANVPAVASDVRTGAPKPR